MNKDLMLETHKNASTKRIPEIKPGYTIEVDTIIREGVKQRIQKFKGLVISITGNGSNKLVTVRKVSNGVGVEKKLPLNSPNIGEIKVIKMESTRRSKLYFMRDRVGKNAMRIKKGKAVFVTDEMRAQEELEMNANEEASQPIIEIETLNSDVSAETNIKGVENSQETAQDEISAEVESDAKTKEEVKA